MDTVIECFIQAQECLSGHTVPTNTYGSYLSRDKPCLKKVGDVLILLDVTSVLQTERSLSGRKTHGVEVQQTSRVKDLRNIGPYAANGKSLFAGLHSGLKVWTITSPARTSCSRRKSCRTKARSWIVNRDPSVLMSHLLLKSHSFGGVRILV
jgi:hypothetical protein